MTGEELQPCELRIGTSGYDYPDWEGVFYPKGIGKSNYLGMYSKTFATIELTSTFATMPTQKGMKKLLTETRRPMDFAVKAHKSLVSSPCVSKLDETIGDFRKCIAPLAKEDRLCAVLLSFPDSFHYDIEARQYLNRILAALSMYPLVVEWRTTCIPR
jgi:uncharacterized protein YecE (DUF72 family)